MQSTRSNLQLKLIDDARKLLEKVRTEDEDAPSIDSSMSSFQSKKTVQKPEPSLSKFADIVFIQKSQSREESDEESVGNLSCSQDKDAYSMDSSSTNSVTAPVPARTTSSFASSLSNDSLDTRNANTSHSSNAESERGNSVNTELDSEQSTNSERETEKNVVYVYNESSGDDKDAYSMDSLSTNNVTSPVPARTTSSFASSLSNDILGMRSENTSHSSNAESERGNNVNLELNSEQSTNSERETEKNVVYNESSGDDKSTHTSDKASASINVRVKPVRKTIVLGSSAASRRTIPQNSPASQTEHNNNGSSVSSIQKATEEHISSAHSKKARSPNSASSTNTGKASHEPDVTNISQSQEDNNNSIPNSVKESDITGNRTNKVDGDATEKLPSSIGIAQTLSEDDAVDLTSVSKSESNEIDNGIASTQEARNNADHIFVSNSQRDLNSNHSTKSSSDNEMLVMIKDEKQADDDKSQIETLKEQNQRLQKENQCLQYDMKTFDEKLACLEVTLGIIDIVETNRTEFDRQADCDEKGGGVNQVEEEDIIPSISADQSVHSLTSNGSHQSVSNFSRSSRKSTQPNEERINDDDASRQSSNSRRSSGSQRSTFSFRNIISGRSKMKKETTKEGVESDEKSYQSAISHVSFATQKSTSTIGSAGSHYSAKSRNGTVIEPEAPQLNSLDVSVMSMSKEGDKENLNCDNRSYMSAVSQVSAASKKSVSSYGSASSTKISTSRDSNDNSVASGKNSGVLSPRLVSAGEENVQNKSAAKRDDKNEVPVSRPPRTGSVSSKVSVSSVNSMSSRERKELKMLRENNEKMLFAIKALSRATAIQTRKHCHYKKKFGCTKKSLEQGTEKISQLIVDKKHQLSEFYEARANYLEEQDKREELSDSVQTLAKKMNVLRRQLIAEEEIKVTILDHMDETIISSDSSQPSLSVSSASSQPSLCSSSVSMDSLDLILFPISEQVTPEEPTKLKENRDMEKSQTVLMLELEITRLKRKLGKKQNQVQRLCTNFKLVQEYLNNKDDVSDSGDDNRKEVVE